MFVTVISSIMQGMKNKWGVTVKGKLSYFSDFCCKLHGNIQTFNNMETDSLTAETNILPHHH
jgi:hypothetical protein